MVQSVPVAPTSQLTATSVGHTAPPPSIRSFDTALGHTTHTITLTRTPTTKQSSFKASNTYTRIHIRVSRLAVNPVSYSLDHTCPLRLRCCLVSSRAPLTNHWCAPLLRSPPVSSPLTVTLCSLCLASVMTTIRVVTPDHSTFLVDYLPHDTSQSLKEKLQLLHNVPTQQAVFFCNGKPVPDGVKLQSIGITPQHVLQAAPSPGLRINVTPTHNQQQIMMAGGVMQPSSPYGPPLSPQLQIQTSFNSNGSPQHSRSFQPAQPRSPYAGQHLSAAQSQSPNRSPNATHGRTRSGSMSTTGYSLGTPPVHPQPNSGKEHTRRRSSLSLPQPSNAPSPFDVVEQTLAKVAAHPISPQLYDKGPQQPSTSTVFSSTQPLPPSPSTATTITDIPAHSPLGRSQSSSSLSPRPQASPGSQPASPRTPSLDTAPSTSTFQPVLSFHSKLTALSIALQEVVDERNLLDKKTDDEKQRIGGIITDKKKDIEHFLWEQQKHAASKQGEVMEEERRLKKLEEEAQRAKRAHEERMKELDDKADQRRSEMLAMQQRMAADEAQRTRAVESARTAIGELMSVKDELSFDKQKAEERAVRQVVDLLLKAGVDLQVLKREVEGSAR